MNLFEIILLGTLGYLLFGTNKPKELMSSFRKTAQKFDESLNEIEVEAKDIHDDKGKKK